MATHVQVDSQGKTDQWKFVPDANNNLWTWVRLAPNGRIVGASFKSYKNKKDCISNAIRNSYRYLTNRPTAFVDSIDMGECDHWEILQQENQLWYWKRLSPNGRVVGASHEGYRNKKDCEFNAARHGFVKFQR